MKESRGTSDDVCLFLVGGYTPRCWKGFLWEMDTLEMKIYSPPSCIRHDMIRSVHELRLFGGTGQAGWDKWWKLQYHVFEVEHVTQVNSDPEILQIYVFLNLKTRKPTRILHYLAHSACLYCDSFV